MKTHSGSRSEPLAPNAELDLLSSAARLLFANGQTTKRISEAISRLANADANADGQSFRANVFPRWNELTIRIEDAENVVRHEVIDIEPAGVDMRKVGATMFVIDRVCDGKTTAAVAHAEFAKIAKFPPVSLLRFSLMASAGAAALSVIFGETHLLNLLLIAISAGAGACLRRWLAHVSSNLFIQPFCAALLAGLIGAIAVHLRTGPMLQLVAVCPCMILVPGAHFLNGALDLARSRIALGIARMTYACLIVLMICTGLLLGLALCGATFPAATPGFHTPLGYDVIAAGIAVAAFGAFFNMPWKILPISIGVGMLAHACRWGMISWAGCSVETGALVACLVAGIITTLVADRLHLPFAGLAFASVVSLMPGVFLFRMAGGMVALLTLGAQASPQIVVHVVANGTSALLVILAMSFGLLFPRLCMNRYREDRG